MRGKLWMLSCLALVACGDDKTTKDEGKPEKREAAPVREPAPKRSRAAAAERPNAKEKDRVHTIDLKSMMAPDPSQLPSEPAPAPKPAPPPPSEPPAQENP